MPFPAATGQTARRNRPNDDNLYNGAIRRYSHRSSVPKGA